MIVISGALVAVAFVLLVIGLFQPDLGFVYASIGVSLGAFVFLLLGIFQRRGETSGSEKDAPPVTTSVGDAATAPGVPAMGGSGMSGTSRGAREEVAPVTDSDASPAAEAIGGRVLVVADRPRYHVEGCRYLAGKSAQELDVRDAREEGFTPCGVCRPDAQLAAAPAAGRADEDTVSLPAEPALDSFGEGSGVDEDAAAVVPAPRSVRTTPTPAGRTGIAKAPAKKAVKAVKAPATRAVTAPAKAERPGKAPAKAGAKAPATSSAKAPAKAGRPAASAAARAASPARKPGTVVVVPDRGKFHTAECRYVRGVDDTQELTKAQATRQGYAACGVCKP